MVKAQIQKQLIFKLDVISSNNILFKKDMWLYLRFESLRPNDAYMRQ